jgi:molybdenum cofactor biosynthesis protein B
VSDTRTGETDVNGKFLKEKIEDAGHSVAFYRIIEDEPDQVLSALEEAVSEKANIALFNGGTGVSSRDTTIDVISGKLEKELPGFGELFRMFSYDQVGAAAMFSRATAGVYRGTAVISIPGSPKAVQLAWEKLIGPELAHLAWEVTR